MAVRPLVILSLLTFVLVAGCSDGPPSGDLVAIPGSLSVDGSTTENTYVAAVTPVADATGGQSDACTPSAVPNGTPLDMGRCVEASSHYKIHFMSLPEPDGNGYAIFQIGGSIEERSLATLLDQGAGMWGVEVTKDGEDQSTMFESFELRMDDFVVASASSAAGSQAFVTNPALAGVTVTGSYKGRTLDLDVQGLPEGPNYVGRLYTRGDSGNLTVAESFPVVSGEQSFEAEFANIGNYAEFHIHVGNSKIYVYQATLGA